MKALLGSIWATSSVTAVGVVMVAASFEAAAAVAAMQIGAGTPISGITVGILAGGAFAGVIFLAKGARFMLELGGHLQTWREGVEKAGQFAETMERISARLDELERWRLAVESTPKGAPDV